MSEKFQTVKPIEITGVGLHSGQNVNVRLIPTDSCGIVFRRVDLTGQPDVKADWRHISKTVHATTLQKSDVKISTPEHLLAALWMAGVTHCTIEIDGPEVPILDGSAGPWCELLQGNTVVLDVEGVRPTFGLREPVFLQDGDASVLALPHSELRVSVAVDFSCHYLSLQNFDAVVTLESFVTDIAKARTFAREAWLEPLRAQGLIRGGSTENAILLGTNAPSTPLRFETELARHKTLDLLGDISLLFVPQGAAFQAHLIAIRAGHSIHSRWMQLCAAQNALISI